MWVGIDLVKVATIAEAVEEHGQRYLDRVFTAQEQVDCRAQALRLAARFAAKEAVMKVLEVGSDQAVPWTDVEVVRQTSGAPTVALHGEAARIAQSKGIARLALSFTHEDEYAAAVVVGT
jgi:holo-[acyl-carrier protein] synthase